MKFKTPCFVRVENLEEREELLNWCAMIGYWLVPIPKEEGNGTLVICDADGVGTVHDARVFTNAECIDCDIDVELFKALAAMNYKNDREQWFTDGMDWRLCHDIIVTKMAIPSYALYHKATAEEIIEHFKKNNL